MMLYNEREVSMAMFLRISGVVLIGTLLLAVPFTGCTPKPSSEEMGKLDEAKAAAESAERKLSDLRMERMKLEQQLGGAQSEEEEDQGEPPEEEAPSE